MIRLLPLTLLLACGQVNEDPQPVEPVVPGAPRAGAAEAYLELPIGTALGCYSGRGLLGLARRDRRQGGYNVGFDESTGIHTRPTIKALWLNNGDADLLVIKFDACMSNDALIADVTRRVEEATGSELQGRVTLSASHTHSGYGCYQDQWHWYLGTDRYNHEIFERTASQIAAVAVEAHDSLQDAKIGAGWAFDWDPNNRVYRDRRGDNGADANTGREELIVWDDQSDWETGKDPHLGMIRVDDMNDEPIAVAVVFGMHGIIMDVDNSIVSTDSSGGFETVLQEEFGPDTVFMHLQGAGGDASPAGSDRDWAKMESIGHHGKDAVLELFDAVPTSAEPISLEVASRHLWQNYDDIQVTRNGTVDWSYVPTTSPDYGTADGQIFGDAGEILSPLDEFHDAEGAVFCGEEVPLLPGAGLNTTVYPYEGCVRVSGIVGLVAGLFNFNVETEVPPLPFREDYKAGTTTSLIGPLPTLTEEGATETRPLMMGFFPGEPVAMYTEQWRRRVQAELGYEHPLLVGYSQDHEGYLLITEDWLRGGYEPSINTMGPLQGDHIMEGVLDYSGQFLGNEVHDDPDPLGHFAPPVYSAEDYTLPTHHAVFDDIVLQPDPTPDAGTRTFDRYDEFYIPRHLRIDADGDGREDRTTFDPFPAQVPRVQGLLEFAWIGGDAMVDPPHVYLEVDNAGSWERVTSVAGRPISEAGPDIQVGYTPDPLFPHDALQTHYYYAAWQAVGHVNDRASLPLGTYRFHVEGLKYVGDSQTWPWASEAYEMTTESFELVPAAVSIETYADGVWAWMQAPDRGFRLVDLEGASQGPNPVRGTIQVELDDGTDGPPTILSVDVAEIAGGKARIPVDLTGYVGVTITDEHGNSGYLALL